MQFFSSSNPQCVENAPLVVLLPLKAFMVRVVKIRCHKLNQCPSNTGLSVFTSLFSIFNRNLYGNVICFKRKTNDMGDKSALAQNMSRRQFGVRASIAAMRAFTGLKAITGHDS